MADHLQHRAAGSQGAEAANANQHKAHVADGAVGDLAFEVALGEGGQGGINDVHHPQHHQQRGEDGVPIRKDLAVEAQQRIAAHLQQDAGQQHVDRGRGLAVGIRQPGVEWNDRQLHAEGDQQARIGQQLELQGEALGHQVAVLKARVAAVEGHRQARQEDEQRAASGVEDEFGGGVLAFFAAPNRQQEIDRNQLQLPGQEEEQHVLDSEDGDLAAIHGQQQEIEQPRLKAHRPGRQDGEGCDEAREQDQRHGDAVGAHRPGQPQFGEPAHPLDQLQIRVAGVVARQVPAHRQ